MVLKYILLSAELILLVMFLISLPFVNVGNIAGSFLCILLMVITVRFDLVKRLWTGTAGKAVIIGVLILFAAGMTFSGFCTVKMLGAMNEDNDSPSAVVVLGCQVRGQRPSKMLKRRLDTAIEYLNEHKELPVIVSGGKGYDEEISEALCMKNYLSENGISEDRIIMEDRSESTDQNLEYSFAILDEMGLPRSIVLITDGYHQYRAQLIAEKHGAEKIGSRSASTEFRFIPTYWVREWFAILQEKVLK
ncbi:Uncharacterized SAM-binding protein YcdF, DUF218 family [Ruminococcaceae bacterium FB2012]|nr:Uncharacterized SAM-binding protein YcdF, DUF218 family [Ruminococcaceae bacterium FB2012]